MQACVVCLWGWSTGAPGALPSHADSTPLHMTLLLACTMWLTDLREGGGRLGQTPLWPLGWGGPGHPL